MISSPNRPAEGTGEDACFLAVGKALAIWIADRAASGALSAIPRFILRDRERRSGETPPFTMVLPTPQGLRELRSESERDESHSLYIDFFDFFLLCSNLK
jgi:hypothetical protein